TPPDLVKTKLVRQSMTNFESVLRRQIDSYPQNFPHVWKKDERKNLAIARSWHELQESKIRE
ncbi:MAG: hypothetical protein KAX16_05990, partial [Actinomycetia bacterium]|nr:hypothetical protein [Actinomycetes bacterium]